MRKIFSLLLVAILLTACLPENVQVPQSPLLSTLERKAGLIAYLGVDGNIFVSDQAGGKLKQLTNDAVIDQNAEELNVYQLPTWAPDGNQLAFARTNGNTSAATATIYVANIDADTVTEVFTSESEFPFYLYWTPDSTSVSFLSTTRSGQSLLLQSASADGSVQTLIDSGSPYYWSWAPDGRTLITHSGGAADSSTPEKLAFIQLQENDIIESALDETPAAFQTPAWSPDGSRIVLTRELDGEKEIILTDSSGTYEKTLGTFGLNAAVGWSSDSTKVAYIEGTRSINTGTLGKLHVVDLETDQKITTEEDSVLAFFWSPNGKKLAYFVPVLVDGSGSGSQSDSGQAANQFLLQLNMLDIATNETHELFTYQPTDQFLSILPYFDQYNQSVTIWSPDNNNLVLSFLDAEGTPGIAIAAASGQMQPRLLTNGYVAYWSWK